MLRPYTLILLGLSLATPAYAGLFADDGARKRIEQLETRAASLEAVVKQQTKLMLDLQGEIDALNQELRTLRGQNEELVHGLQDAEKRQKDFYVDLDTRLRSLETAKEAASSSSYPVTASSDPNDPAMENRDYENAYATLKRGDHADAVKAFKAFLQNYPDSVHTAHATYWLGNAQFSLKEYKGALGTYQGLLKKFPDTPKAADAYLNIAECKRILKYKDEPQKTLKQLIADFPKSDAAAKARKQLAAYK
ncbi:MAG TPA: tol-pal system protein YbgF [Gallionella sp.]